MPRERRPPAERVRERLARVAGTARAGRMPAGYQRLGRVLVVRLPDDLRPFFPVIGAAWQEALGVATVLVRTGPISGEFRRPRTETIAGGPTETEVVEHGVRWRFDAAEVMFAAGNRTERRRAASVVRPGEVVVDMFAGIGYFAIPAARTGRPARVVAIEKNRVAARYLRENAALNGVADRLEVVEGDNRRVGPAAGAADRIFLGYLPSAVPWVPRAVELLRDDGGWLHVHTVTDARGALDAAVAAVSTELRASGRRAVEARAREVKPYGPGRAHVVVDARVGPVDRRSAVQDSAGTGI
ncbi:MAG TPA: 50S ribosomal protein L11 methyltransferase [Thermoplasmata archaeon]|nr:50S ribosomal protein L11 methyltransferase [Thermoplasmata archaeon]